MQGEFRGDFSRDTFDPLKHFRRVFMQQGRVQLDADWNEQTSILLHYMRTLAADLIGPQGGPVDSNSGAVGFLIGSVTSAVTNDFRIGLGHYYVDGILCEADSTPMAISIPPSFQGSSITVQVDHWTLDGIPFQANQYVEVFDDVQSPGNTPAFTPTVVQIANPQQAQLTLTLQGVPASLAKAAAPKLRRVITYLTQPDYPIPPGGTLAATTYLVYLDVWERHITYVEDDSIREVALGGPDTATRAKVVWQVKAAPGTAGKTTDGQTQTPCDNFTFISSESSPPGLFNMNRGRLKAMAKQATQSTDPCIVSPRARYRGAENQLYRVEIHTGGAAWSGKGTPPTAGAATFKWSRENGSVIFPIMSISAGGGSTTVVLENLGRDDRFGLKPGEWIEVQDDPSILQNRAEHLLQVQSIDRTSMTVTLNGVPGSSVEQDVAKHPLLRRWEQQAGDPAEGGLQIASDGAAYIIEGTWLTLEDGVQIQFQPPIPSANQQQPVVNQYVTSDYWIIPARTTTGDVMWPQEARLDSQGNSTLVPIAKPPDGIEHHYAPLAVITVDTNGISAQSCQKTFDAIGKFKPAS